MLKQLNLKISIITFDYRCSQILRFIKFGIFSKFEGFSQQAITGVAVARMFLPVHAHVCSMDASCFFMGPRWLIYPILSYPFEIWPIFSEFSKFAKIFGMSIFRVLMHSPKFTTLAVRSSRFAVYLPQFAVHSLQFTVHQPQCAVHMFTVRSSAITP